MKETLFILVLLLLGNTLPAQEAVPTKSAAHLFSLGLGLDTPLADLKDRFGRFNKISGGYNYLSSNDFIFGGDISYYYGDNVKEDVLSVFREPNGTLISNAEVYADVFLRHRGLYMGGEVGKIFSFKNKYRSGIKTSLGLGFLEHRIRINDNGQNLTKLFGERKKGYDRLSRGLALRQFIGYHHLSSNRRINYSIGFEVTEAWTSSVRAVNWDTGQPGQSGRFDVIVGIKAVWILPFWTGVSNEDIYY